MASALDQQILDVIVTKLAAITTGNGYQQTVLAANIHRPPQSLREFSAGECPGLSVRLESKENEYDLRGSEELLIGVNIQCAATSAVLLRALISDVKKLAYANKRWNDGSANLALRTWIDEDFAHEPEVEEAVVTGSVHLTIKARADQTDPTAVKAI